MPHLHQLTKQPKLKHFDEYVEDKDKDKGRSEGPFPLVITSYQRVFVRTSDANLNSSLEDVCAASYFSDSKYSLIVYHHIIVPLCSSIKSSWWAISPMFTRLISRQSTLRQASFPFPAPVPKRPFPRSISCVRG